MKLNFAPLAISLFLAAPILAFAQSFEVQRVEAQGHGKVRATPDTARIKMALVSFGPTAQGAVDANSAATKAITDALKAKLGDRIQIESTVSALRESRAPRAVPVPPTWWVHGWVDVEIPSSEQAQLIDATKAAHIPNEHVEGITSRGRGDAATVTITVSSTAGSAKEAAALNADRIQKLLEVIKANVGPEAKITSQALSQIHAPETVQFGVGDDNAYTAQNELLLQPESVAQVAQVVDEVKALGAERLEGVTFDLRDPSIARTEAIRRATVEAQQKAQAEAAALGLKLGPLLNSDVAKSLPVHNARGNASDLASSDDDQMPNAYCPSEITVSADVTLTYSVH